MTLTTKFNSTYSFKAVNDNILCVMVRENGNGIPSVIYLYDFSACMLHTRLYGENTSSTPFCLLDRRSLETHHAKLCEYGGHPPPLPLAESQDNIVKLASIKNGLPLP